jgi:hypothetical protein
VSWGRKIILSFAVMVSFTGCAASVKNDSPSSFSVFQYQHYNCGETRGELTGCSLTAQEMAGLQGQGANKDGWDTGVGMVLFW